MSCNRVWTHKNVKKKLINMNRTFFNWNKNFWNLPKIITLIFFKLIKIKSNKIIKIKACR